jgi:cyclopropane fatty-acyl-phospholipid synthase-like methyltransferase
MGPNALWLTEALSEVLDLAPGQHVLDLGCGRAASSIFLAREFGVSVVAADLWIAPAENLERILEAAVETLVVPVYADAHALPFESESFDVVVSLDAYHYFGTDTDYLEQLVPVLRPNGIIGIVVPGVRDESDRAAADIAFGDEARLLHSPEWWRAHWERSGLVAVESATWLTDGWSDWLRWTELCVTRGVAPQPDFARREVDMLRADQGRTFGFSRVVARKR